jgi:4'-phosphopantetheinyl transferase EntD
MSSVLDTATLDRAIALQRVAQNLFEHARVQALTFDWRAPAGDESHPKRVAELHAGRQCARAALTILGCHDASLVADADGVPQWPAGWLGTISHSQGCCLAAVGYAARVWMLGVDLERERHFRAASVTAICTERERKWIQAAEPSVRACLTTLVFSAKEAYYKAQFPRYRQPLDFSDVELAVAERTGRFDAHPTREGVAAGRLGGTFALHDGFVICAIEVPATI